MLFSLLLVNIIILLWFYFLVSVAFSIFFTILVEIENARLKLVLAIPTGAQITVANVDIEMVPVVTDKAINNL